MKTESSILSNFLWIPGAHLSLGPAIGTGHEARARILFGREPAYRYAQGRTENVSGTGKPAFNKGKNARSPGADPRNYYANRHSAGQLPASMQSTFDRVPGFIRVHPTRQSNSRRLGCSNPCFGPSSQSNATSPGGRLMGMRSTTPGNKDRILGIPVWRGLGEICARQTCPLKGKPPLTAKSLSASTV